MDGVIVDAQSNSEAIEQIKRLNSNSRIVITPATGRVAVCVGSPLATVQELKAICLAEKKG